MQGRFGVRSLIRAFLSNPDILDIALSPERSRQKTALHQF